MLSIDTNIFVHAVNKDADHHQAARIFLEEAVTRQDVILAEYILVELYLLLRNPLVFARPLSSGTAASICRRFRTNPNWQVVECRPVMDEVWARAERADFSRRRIIDVRLGLTLVAAGVTQFATRNRRDFLDIGFGRVFDPTETGDETGVP